MRRDATGIQDIIRRKRDGERLSDPDIARFVRGLADGSCAREQAAAMAMAIFLRSMDDAETASLTGAMARSGTVLDWRADALGGPVLDKHSTGGVGDKVSLVLAPILAACGAFVPMISGRGLGHTGGTLDKLASIPGYDPVPGIELFRRAVREAGCAIVGQTGDLAPADRALYAIRDATATIESTPLIIASILSKKVAAGLDGLLLDVKTGSGAFMRTDAQASGLATAIIAAAARLDLPTRALITDMNEVLGLSAGNAVEVAEAIAYLSGGPREARLDELVLALAAELLVLGGLADVASARDRAARAIASGAAAERFAGMVAALGGPADLIEHPRRYLPDAPVTRPVLPAGDGVLVQVDTWAIGEAIIRLGGGRTRMDDAIDPRVGFVDIVPIGSAVGRHRPLAFVHAASEAAAERAAADYRAACTIGDTPPPPRPVVRAAIDAEPLSPPPRNALE